MNKWGAVVVGGGPAGLVGAIEMAKSGVKVLLIDENDRPGGQLFKQIHKFFGSKAHSAGIRGMNIGQSLLEQTEKVGVTVWLGSTVIGLTDDKELSIIRSTSNGLKESCIVKADRVLLACGGAENAINFEGWTLPGVMSAGAAQTMINVHRVLPGQKVLMVGSGNVGLIVSYQLMQAGADVVGIVEAADNIGGYGVHAAKVRRAGVPLYIKHTIIKALAKYDEVSSAIIGQLDEQGNIIQGTEKELDVDTICLAVGLHPLAQLSLMTSIKHEYIPEMGGWMPMHNENMETSIAGIYVAGDIAGVEEANSAMDEGRLAGVAIAQSLKFLPEEQGEKEKQNIRERLEGLRQGPFGTRRINAKMRIVKTMSEEN